jgi:hypothetical protein
MSSTGWVILLANIVIGVVFWFGLGCLFVRHFKRSIKD